MSMDAAGCVNCGRVPATRRCHVHFTARQAVEIDLCRGCYRRFVAADWATVVD